MTSMLVRYQEQLADQCYKRQLADLPPTADWSMMCRVAYRDTSNTDEVNSDQEHGEASNPGREQAPQPALGEEGHNGGGKGAHHVGPQKLPIGVVPGVALGLSITTMRHRYTRATTLLQQ